MHAIAGTSNLEMDKLYGRVADRATVQNYDFQDPTPV